MNAETPTKLLVPLPSHVAPVSGECQTHGAATVLTRAGMDWHCPECLELAKAAEIENKFRVERMAHLHSIATIPSKYCGQKFVPTTAEHKAVRVIAASFRDFVVAEPRWATLILMGDVGTGKTQLACEFAESYINRLGRSVRYVTAKGMISEIQACYGKEGKSEEVEVDRFVQYDMLVLDEIDAIPSRDNAALLLTEIINKRYSNDKPMIVITNQPFDGLAQYVGDRVHDRLHENAFVCAFDWPSFRRSP